MSLPVEFTEKMKALLGTEYEEFAAGYETDRVSGLRFNPLKVDREEFLKKVPFSLEKIPWAEEGYYYKAEERPGKHPLHEAGLYYIQEPSAMAAVELLDPKPGERILDLCGAPGGKTTQIAGRLKGEGFLLSNEVHPARAKILSQNVERMGIGAAVVSNEDPAKLRKRFLEFFDRIAVDAPCSGEGMFRKDEHTAGQWSKEHVTMCAARQREILENAAAMLKPGGRLVYSTCTFSPEENEQTVEAFLARHPDFTVEGCKEIPGLDHARPEWSLGGREDLSRTYRIWPHRAKGEGHYLAVLKKDGVILPSPAAESFCGLKDRALWKAYEEMMKNSVRDPARFLERKEYCLFGDQLYLVPREMPDFSGLKILRPGLHVGTVKKNRFEPAHALAMHLHPDEAVRSLDLKADGGDAIKYLRGETLAVSSGQSGPNMGKGWVLVSVEGCSAGWGKAAGEILKNHYPKGLRLLT